MTVVSFKMMNDYQIKTIIVKYVSIILLISKK